MDTPQPPPLPAIEYASPPRGVEAQWDPGGVTITLPPVRSGGAVGLLVVRIVILSLLMLALVAAVVWMQMSLTGPEKLYFQAGPLVCICLVAVAAASAYQSMRLPTVLDVHAGRLTALTPGILGQRRGAWPAHVVHELYYRRHGSISPLCDLCLVRSFLPMRALAKNRSYDEMQWIGDQLKRAASGHAG